MYILFWDGENVTLSKVVGDFQRRRSKGHELNHLGVGCFFLVLKL